VQAYPDNVSMKTFFYFSILIFFGSFYSCRHQEIDSPSVYPPDSSATKINGDSLEASVRPTPRHFTPLTFIDALTSGYHPDFSVHITTMMGDFPENWVKRHHIDSLIILVDSKTKCNCFMNPLSSFVSNDSSEVGGYAIIFINSFRYGKKVSLGFYTCAKAEEASAEEIKKWWSKYKQTK
jgi:hypothetical protein